MRYFVIAPNGQRFGPADVALLNQWALEGRVDEHTELEDAATGAKLAAASVPGFVPARPQPTPIETPQQPAAQWQHPPGTYSNYPRPQTTTDVASTEVLVSWILGAITIAACCPALPIIGLIMANKALAMGNTQGSAPRIFNIVMLVGSLLVYVGYAILFAVVIATG